jgi:hypothetical protein
MMPRRLVRNGTLTVATSSQTSASLVALVTSPTLLAVTISTSRSIWTVYSTAVLAGLAPLHQLQRLLAHAASLSEVVSAGNTSNFRPPPRSRHASISGPQRACSRPFTRPGGNPAS